ncbi:membrane protein insertase YidC [Sideroxydans lithotrophicus]|uniref:Membrane protein insertase YidC n=1 Tax=Sideroxydans lithotrophicus (strain ES-1) TaxID=580332 RepID=D5CQJ8_SIDLE|nr:membrane protein insertase YidC [Sideroxydans lithotrophicus]ADE13219.1 membrane protein insertase, YidC/Oxa1 family domain containing protein [Sideroxydans lithotrophicus ES-1]
MDLRRLFLFLTFSFSLVLLWSAWTRQNEPSAQAESAVIQKDPSVPLEPARVSEQQVMSSSLEAQKTSAGKKIDVTTDIFKVVINTTGGNIQHLDLLKHKDAIDKSKPLTLMQQQGDRIYIAQSGLLGKGLPTHNAEFSVTGDQFHLSEGKDDLEVRLTALDSDEARVTKVYTFHRGSYLIDVTYEIENKSQSALLPSAYFQLVRDSTPVAGASRFVPTFTGPAIYTEQEKFRKIQFSDIEKNKAKLPLNPDNGWIGMLQHYFVSAWLPEAKGKREFYAKKLDGNEFSAGVILPVAKIEPGQTGKISAELYAGPAQSKLDKIAPGLGLTVDYGWLTIIATPLFWLLSHIDEWIHNWGVSIILLTVLIKLAFFPLSAASYRSMAKMRLVAPKLEKIKQQYSDDREKLNHAMMDLYKTEKINPLGGCLPMIIQIPVFIALYWAILSSVELRHAPFFGWITDLSAADPYYVLPLIMGLSMLVQSKLNPVPPDPMQAKLMQIMPIVFSVVFFFFPAGLVLYSVVNNILSIAQQWYITRGTKAATKGVSKA